MSGQSLSRREKPHQVAVFISEFPHYSIVASALYMQSEIASNTSL